jgi:hypothetical protein
MKTAKRYFENMERFNFMTTEIDQNLIHEGIKSGLSSGNVFYNSVQNTLSSRP